MTSKTTIKTALVVTLALLLITTPALANNDFVWEQPENKHDINEFDYDVSWSLDDDKPTETNDNTTFGDIAASESDYSYDTPPTHPQQWNNDELAQFDTTNSKSIHPPHINPTDGGYIKDAYVTIPAIANTSTFHKNDTTTKRMSPINGFVYTITDYRVDVPDDSSSSDRRVDYNLRNTRIENTELTTETGDGSTHQENSHTSKLEYTDLQQQENTLTVQTTITATIDKNVEEKVTRTVEDCVTDPDTGNESCTTETITEWETTQDTTLDSTHTVTDTINTHAYDPTMSVEYRQLNNGDSIARFMLPKYWTSIKLPQGHLIDGPVDTYTQRNTAWDSVVTSTATGTSSESQSPITPIETHAFPNKEQAQIKYDSQSRDGNIEITYQSGTQHTVPTLPETIDFRTADGKDTYLSPTTIEISANKKLSPDSINIPKYTIYSVSNTDMVTEGTNLNAPIKTTLDMQAHSVDRHNQTVELNISLTETDTGTPIQTQDTDGYITLEPGNTIVQTDSNGNATATIEYAQGNPSIKASYYPETTFNTKSYDASADRVLVREPSLTASDTLQYILDLTKIILPIALIYYYFHRRIPRILPWPPWKQ